MIKKMYVLEKQVIIDFTEEVDSYSSLITRGLLRAKSKVNETSEIVILEGTILNNFFIEKSEEHNCSQLRIIFSSGEQIILESLHQEGYDDNFFVVMEELCRHTRRKSVS